jgi:hypothetical protein
VDTEDFDHARESSRALIKVVLEEGLADDNLRNRFYIRKYCLTLNLTS